MKLRSIIYYLDRTLGKPTERVEMDVNTGNAPTEPIDLSPEEVAVLQRVVRRQAGVVDTDAVVKSSS